MDFESLPVFSCLTFHSEKDGSLSLFPTRSIV